MIAGHASTGVLVGGSFDEAPGHQTVGSGRSSGRGVVAADVEAGAPGYVAYAEVARLVRDAGGRRSAAGG